MENFDFSNIKKGKLSKDNIILTDQNGNTIKIQNTNMNIKLYKQYISKSSKSKKKNLAISLVLIGILAVSGKYVYNKFIEQTIESTDSGNLDKKENLIIEEYNVKQKYNKGLNGLDKKENLIIEEYNVEQEYNKVLNDLNNNNIENSEEVIAEAMSIFQEDLKLLKMYKEQVDLDNLIKSIKEEPNEFFTYQVRHLDDTIEERSASIDNMKDIIVVKPEDFEEMKNNNRLKPDAEYIVVTMEMYGILRIHEIDKNQHYPVADSILTLYKTDSQGQIKYFNISSDGKTKVMVNKKDYTGMLSNNLDGNPVYKGKTEVLAIKKEEGSVEIYGHNYMISSGTNKYGTPSDQFGKLDDPSLSFNKTLMTLSTDKGIDIHIGNGRLLGTEFNSISDEAYLKSFEFNKITNEFIYDEDKNKSNIDLLHDFHGTTKDSLELIACNNNTNTVRDRVFANYATTVNKKLMDEYLKSNGMVR